MASYQGGSGFASRPGLSARQPLFGSSNPQPNDQIAINIESGNAYDLDDDIMDLRNSVGRLKQVSSAIHEENQLTRQIMDGLESAMETARLTLKQTVKRLDRGTWKRGADGGGFALRFFSFSELYDLSASAASGVIYKVVALFFSAAPSFTGTIRVLSLLLHFQPIHWSKGGPTNNAADGAPRWKINACSASGASESTREIRSPSDRQASSPRESFLPLRKVSLRLMSRKVGMQEHEALLWFKDGAAGSPVTLADDDDVIDRQQ